MRNVVINNSGNVGKSLVCQYVLKPNLKNSEIIQVETLNHSDNEEKDKSLSAKEFDEIFKRILMSDKNVIVDVGSSNVEEFQNKLSNEFAGSHSLIDYFIIPVVPDEKQQRDTINTLDALSIIGVQKEQIKIILNKVETSNLEKEFEILYAHLREIGFIGENGFFGFPVIKKTSIFDTLSKNKLSFSDISNLPKSSELAKEVRRASKEERVGLEIKLFLKYGVESFEDNLKTAFNSLNLDTFPDYTIESKGSKPKK